jgi:elongation factor G
MKKFDTKDIRNVVLVSHGGAGKTSLAEAFLFDAKVTTRLGSVDEGNSNLDCEPEELKRKITLSTALASFEWKKVKINLLDTPGDTNFFVDTRAAMAVADAAVLAVSAPDGVQVGTEKVWEYAAEMALPLAVFASRGSRTPCRRPAPPSSSPSARRPISRGSSTSCSRRPSALALTAVTSRSRTSPPT